jgi:nucleoside-diphosphate-sugar epimerase
MTADALSTGTISLANPRANRAILGLSDLVSAVMLILGDPAVSEGCYNLCSENVTMLDVATQIANLTGASVEYMPDSPTYDFSMSIEKARTRLGWKPAQTVDSIAGEMVATHRP